MSLISGRSSSAYLGVLLTVLFAVTACSKNTVRLEHDDPARYSIAEDVLWASPDGFDLTMDIYNPRGDGAPHPVVVMFHGGGWLINDNSIMDQAAAYLATNGKYVVCNVNYRLLSDNDNSVTMNQIVEDTFGAVLWIKDNIAKYGGDATKIAVTGDSAGGHLSAMIVNSGNQLRTHGFSKEPLGFNPSYLPAGKSAEDAAREQLLTVQAAILSYGAFDIVRFSEDGFENNTNIFWLMSGSRGRGLFGKDYNVTDNPERYRAVSPIYNVPLASERELPPQLLTVGSEDSLITPASVQAYAKKLEEAGHSVAYWEHEGRAHAFLDSGSNMLLGQNFEDDAPPALDAMLLFLNSIFYQ